MGEQTESRGSRTSQILPGFLWAYKELVIGQIVDKATDAAGPDNPSVKVVLPKGNTGPAWANQCLGQVIGLVTDIQVHGEQAYPKDVHKADLILAHPAFNMRTGA